MGVGIFSEEDKLLDLNEFTKAVEEEIKQEDVVARALFVFN